LAERIAAMRHAQAVYRIAEEENKLDKWRQDLAAIVSLIEDAYIKAFLQNPKVSLKDKRRILADGLGGMNPLVLNLVYLLISKGRLELLPDISGEYRLQEKNLAQHLSILTDKKVVLKTKVEPEIISGMIIRVGDKMIDGSTRSKLAVLKKELSEGGV